MENNRNEKIAQTSVKRGLTLFGFDSENSNTENSGIGIGAAGGGGAPKAIYNSKTYRAKMRLKNKKSQNTPKLVLPNWVPKNTEKVVKKEATFTSPNSNLENNGFNYEEAEQNQNNLQKLIEAQNTLKKVAPASSLSPQNGKGRRKTKKSKSKRCFTKRHF